MDKSRPAYLGLSIELLRERRLTGWRIRRRTRDCARNAMILGQAKRKRKVVRTPVSANHSGGWSNIDDNASAFGRPNGPFGPSIGYASNSYLSLQSRSGGNEGQSRFDDQLVDGPATDPVSL